MYYNLIYKNLNQQEKQVFHNFIKKNFNIDHKYSGLENNTIIIANIENNQILGIICLLNNKILKNILINKKVNLNFYDINDLDGMFIYNLCVDKNHRKTGIGNELIHNCLEFIKDYKFKYVHCHAENETSEKLFLKNNFLKINSHTRANNNNFWVMNKYI